MPSDRSSPGGDVMINISEKTSGLWKCMEDGITISEWGYYLLVIQPYIQGMWSSWQWHIEWVGQHNRYVVHLKWDFGRKELKRIEIGYWRSNRRPPGHLTWRWCRSGLHGWQWQVKFSWRRKKMRNWKFSTQNLEDKLERASLEMTMGYPSGHVLWVVRNLDWSLDLRREDDLEVFSRNW